MTDQFPGFEPSTAEPTTPAPRRWIWLVAVLAVVLVAGLGGFLVLKPRPDRSDPTAISSPTDISSPTATPSPTRTGPATGRKLGLIGPWSGEYRDLVGPLRQAVVLAVDEYNAAHPAAPVALVELDTKYDDGEVARGAVEDGVDDDALVGVIGPVFGGETDGVAGTFEDAGLPFITISGRSSLTTDGWKMLHRGISRDADEGVAAAAYLRNTVKAERVYVVVDDSVFGLDAGREATSVLGAAHVGRSKVTAGQTKFTEVVNAVLSTKADAVFMTSPGAEAGRLLRQLRAAGWKGTLLGTSSMMDEDFAEIGGSVSRGTVVVATGPPPVPKSDPFAVAFARRFHKQPGYMADVAYDLARIYLEGIAAGTATRAEMQAFLGGYRGTGAASKTVYAWGPTGELAAGAGQVWAWKATARGWSPLVQVPLA